MARGWESKSVESQVEARQNSREVRMPHRTAEEGLKYLEDSLSALGWKK
jgi:hypothetical protein